MIQTYLPDHPVIQAVANDDAAAFYDAELESAQTVRLAAIRPRGQADHRARGSRGGPGEGDRDGGPAARRGPRSTARGRSPRPGAGVHRPARRAGGDSTSSFAATTRWRVLGGDPGVPWSVDVDPESAPLITIRAASNLYSAAVTLRPIITLGDPRLRLKGEPVDSFGKYLHELLDDLTAHDARRARRRPGRAAGWRGAPGVRRSRSRASSTSWSIRRIVAASGDDNDLEGCLSIPGYVAYVTRREQVWVVAQNRHGRKIKVNGNGLLSRARAARARPSRRQAVHRLPRVDGRPDPGRAAPEEVGAEEEELAPLA